MFYSASTRGFYDRDIHGNTIPQDAVEITAEQHQALLAGQAAGKVIAANEDGKPVLVDPAPPTAEDLSARATAARAAAYAAESDPLFFKSQRGEATKEEWIAKVQEIKERFPRP